MNCENTRALVLGEDLLQVKQCLDLRARLTDPGAIDQPRMASGLAQAQQSLENLDLRARHAMLGNAW